MYPRTNKNPPVYFTSISTPTLSPISVPIVTEVNCGETGSRVREVSKQIDTTSSKITGERSQE